MTDIDIIGDVEIYHIDQITPYENNPRINGRTVDKLKRAIQAKGFLQPLLLDSEGVIISGHARYKAAKGLGMTHLPCMVAHNLTPQQVKEVRIEDNRIGENSEWIIGDLELELEGMDEGELDLLGFDLIPEPLDTIYPVGIDNDVFEKAKSEILSKQPSKPLKAAEEQDDTSYSPVNTVVKCPACHTEFEV